MIRFLVTILLLALAYLGITALSKYDTTISILVWDYKIDLSFFLLAVIIIMVITLSSLGMRVIAIILKMPYIIAEKLSGYKKRSRVRTIMESYGQVVMGNLDSAQRMIARIDMRNLDEEYKEHINLLAAICNQDFDKNMPMLQNLLSNKEYHDFAAKTLAKKLFDQGYYAQSLQYAEQVRLATTNDPEVMYLLAKLYAHSDLWEKFHMSLERYVGIYPKQAHLIKDEIASYYMKAAKFTIAEGAEAKAIEYLQQSLEYDPINQESIEMFCKLNLALGRSGANVDVLEKAFSLAPSFAIFELYNQSCSYTASEIYQKLGSLVDVISYRDIFFAIAACLDLQDEIKVLRRDSATRLLTL